MDIGILLAHTVYIYHDNTEEIGVLIPEPPWPVCPVLCGSYTRLVFGCNHLAVGAQWVCLLHSRAHATCL